jgi:hypothetical protein
MSAGIIGMIVAGILAWSPGSGAHQTASPSAATPCTSASTLPGASPIVTSGVELPSSPTVALCPSVPTGDWNDPDQPPPKAPANVAIVPKEGGGDFELDSAGGTPISASSSRTTEDAVATTTAPGG